MPFNGHYSFRIHVVWANKEVQHVHQNIITFILYLHLPSFDSQNQLKCVLNQDLKLFKEKKKKKKKKKPLGSMLHLFVSPFHKKAA